MLLDETFSVTLPDGTAVTHADIDLLLLDHERRKLVLARLHPALRAIPLWRGPEYDAAGEWTQEQAEARLSELLAGMTSDDLVN